MSCSNFNFVMNNTKFCHHEDRSDTENAQSGVLSSSQSAAVVRLTICGDIYVCRTSDTATFWEEFGNGVSSHFACPLGASLFFINTLKKRFFLQLGIIKYQTQWKCAFSKRFPKAFCCCFQFQLMLWCIESLRYAKIELRNTIIAFRKPLAWNYK